MTASFPTPETQFIPAENQQPPVDMKWVPAILFVGGSCDGMAFPETRDIAEFTVTIPGKDGNPATTTVEQYRRVTFELGSGFDSIVMYLISTMKNDDVLSLRIRVYTETLEDE